MEGVNTELEISWTLIGRFAFVTRANVNALHWQSRFYKCKTKQTDRKKKEMINASHHYIDHVWPLEVGDSIINMEVLFVMFVFDHSQHLSVSSQVFRRWPLQWPDWRG